MTLYIHRSLAGTENDDVLAYVETFVGDDNVDAYLSYNSIYGLGGDDEITVDYKPVVFIDGGAGEDIINYQSSPLKKGATILGGAGNDTIWIGLSNEVFPLRIDGGKGADTLEIEGYGLDTRGVRNVEKLLMLKQVNVQGDLSGFTSVDARDEITFLSAADLSDVNFVRSSQPVRINGSEKKDLLDVSTQKNGFSIYGGGGNDTIIGGSGGLTANGGVGVDFIQGGTGDDKLDAGMVGKKQSQSAAETVLGMNGDDVVTFNGATGYYDGGNGNDTFETSFERDNALSLAHSTAVGFEVLSLAYDEIFVNQEFFTGLDRIKGYGTVGFVEAVRVTELPAIQTHWIKLVGSDHSDIFKLNGADSRIEFRGGAGRDVFSGALRSVTLYGEDGGDLLSGGGSKDTLYGGDGNDWLDGGGRNDSILGGNGNDTIFGGDGNDIINAGTGADIVKGGAGNDRLEINGLRARDHQVLSGGSGNDYFLYGEFSDTHYPHGATLEKAATLTILGGSGSDTANLSGNLRNVSAQSVETLVFHDMITATPEFLDGFDKIKTSVFGNDRPEAWIYFASSGSWTWRGAGIEAVIVGSDGVDTLDFSGSGKVKYDIYLGAGNDVFHFGAGGIASDMLVHGGEGDDIFYGGKGNDLFKGEKGHDIFVAGGNAGVDVFDNFTATGDDSDIINLRGVADIENYKDLKKNHLKSYEGTYYIDMGAHGLLVLGASSAVHDLSEDNFLF